MILVNIKNVTNKKVSERYQTLKTRRAAGFIHFRYRVVLQPNRIRVSRPLCRGLTQ